MERTKKTLVKPSKVKLLTATEAAAEIGKSTAWLGMKRRAGEVTAELMDNGHWGFPEWEVERLRLRTPRRLMQQQNIKP